LLQTYDLSGRIINIPVFVFSQDGISLDFKAPSIAVPPGIWQLNWIFKSDPSVKGAALGISISQFVPITGALGGIIQPGRNGQSQPPQFTATVNNLLTPLVTLPSPDPPSLPPPSAQQNLNGFGYTILVTDATPLTDATMGTTNLKPASHDPSIALVQDPIGG
jgi:hypothetical protein